MSKFNMPSTLDDAIQTNQRQFYSGIACKHGHIAPRDVVRSKQKISSRCSICQRLSLEKAKLNSDYSQSKREISRRWRNKNPDYAVNWKRKKASDRPFYHLISSIKSRCKSKGIAFDLDEAYLEDIVPKDGLCPILRIPLSREKGSGNSYLSVDRIRPCLGYVKGNVAIISSGANLIKQDCTDSEVFRRLADWLDAQL